MVSSLVVDSPTSFDGEKQQQNKGATQRFDEAGVASLSPRSISKMSRDELIEAIRVVKNWRPGRASERALVNRLQYLDSTTLERLVYLARRCCRNRIE